jgi:hypothetical protein
MVGCQSYSFAHPSLTSPRDCYVLSQVKLDFNVFHGAGICYDISFDPADLNVGFGVSS